MIRNLKALGLALVAVCAMSAVASSAASASPALFTAAGVVAPEKAGAIGGQTGTDTFTIGALPGLTCGVATVKGEAITAGPSSTYVKLEPTYEVCHIVAPLIGTRTATVTVNGCTYTFNATKGTTSSATGPTPGVPTPFSADLHITCPVGKSIEIHIYNSATAHTPVLCTYDIDPQTVLDQIELTNNTTPKPDDIVADIHATVKVTNTILGGLCGNTAEPHAIYKGTDTIQATKAKVAVNTTVS